MLASKRKNEIKASAVSVLLAADIHSLPIDLNQIVSCYDWCCLSYSEAEKEGVLMDPGEDGQTITEMTHGGWLFTILYRDSLPQRVRWTIAHEIGHIVLGHIGSSIPSSQANEEAQYFAEQLLSPIAVVAHLGATTVEDIMRICNLSREAAEWRYKDLERHLWYRKQYGYTYPDKAFLHQFNL